MTDKEAMQMALDALEEATTYTSSPTWSPSMTEECEAAATALCTALARPEQEPFGYFKAEPFGWTGCAETDEGAIPLYERPVASSEALRTALARPEQEPVAWCIVENGRVNGLVKSRPAVMNAEKWQPLYTAPQQSEWKSLTDDEIYVLVREASRGSALRRDGSTSLRIARAIEAKLKEKNT